MRQIIRRREVVADELRYPGESLPGGAVAVHTLASLLVASRQPAGDGGLVAPAAVLLTATDEVEVLEPHLPALRWIVIEFAKLGEGRGYSQARLLRQRCRYVHELRARGAVKRDQLFFLARCGFDAFELDAAEDPVAAVGALDTFSVAYQDGSNALAPVRVRPPGAAA